VADERVHPWEPTWEPGGDAKLDGAEAPHLHRESPEGAPQNEKSVCSGQTLSHKDYSMGVKGVVDAGRKPPPR